MSDTPIFDQARQAAGKDAKELAAGAVVRAVASGRIHYTRTRDWSEYLAARSGAELSAGIAELEKLPAEVYSEELSRKLEDVKAQRAARAAAGAPGASPVSAASMLRTPVGGFPGASRVASAAYYSVQHPAYAAAASSGVPAPVPFHGGDLPPITASGVDPHVLDQLPWQARWAAAKAGTAGEVYQMITDYGGPDGETLCEMDRMAGRLGSEPDQYVAEFRQWLASAGTPANSGPAGPLS